MDKDFILQRISENILLERRRRHFTQEVLAEKAGISQRYLSKIEATKVNPSITVIINICEALGIDKNTILNFD